MSLFAALALALVLVSAASADRFQGNFDHHRRKMVLVTGKSKLPKAIKFRHWRADCRDHGGSLKQTSSFFKPLDRSSKSFLHDKGSFAIPPAHGYSARATTAVTGHRVSARKWVGTFQASVKLKRHGHFFDHCKTGTTHWTARR